MEAHQNAALFGDIAHRQASTVTIAPEFAHDRRQDTLSSHLADVPQGVNQNGLLEVNLGTCVQMLHHATAASSRSDTEVGAGRFDAQIGSAQDFLHNADFIARFVANLLIRNGFSGQSTLNEDDLTFTTRHASAFGIKFFHLRFKNRAYFFLAGTHCWGFLLVCGVSISERIAPHN